MISNYIHGFMWDVITHPVRNLDGWFVVAPQRASNAESVSMSRRYYAITGCFVRERNVLCLSSRQSISNLSKLCGLNKMAAIFCQRQFKLQFFRRKASRLIQIHWNWGKSLTEPRLVTLSIYANPHGDKACTESSLVQTMTCRLASVRSLPESTLVWYQLDPSEKKMKS